MKSWTELGFLSLGVSLFLGNGDVLEEGHECLYIWDLNISFVFVKIKMLEISLPFWDHLSSILQVISRNIINEC